MAELIVSYLVEDLSANPYGQRVWDNGQVEGYMVSRPVQGSDGSFRDQGIVPGWYPLVEFSSQQVAAVRQWVDEAGLHDLPAYVQDQGTGDTSSETATWQADHKTVKISKWPAVGQASGLLKLSERIGDLVLAAQGGSKDVPGG